MKRKEEKMLVKNRDKRRTHREEKVKIMEKGAIKAKEEQVVKISLWLPILKLILISQMILEKLLRTLMMTSY